MKNASNLLPVSLIIAALNKMNKTKSMFLIIAVLFVFLGSIQLISSQTPKVNLHPSLKGYELYSWKIKDEWYFSVLPGTNRLKIRSEIVDSPQVRVKGIAALKRRLNQLPKGEHVTWSSYFVPNMPLPPENIVKEISAYCKTRGITLNVVKAPSQNRVEEQELIKNAPPGDIRLLAYYSHTPEQGIDTRVGKIWKEGGLVIRYDIGGMAGHYVNSTEQANYLWSKEQIIKGKLVKIALTKTQQLIITFPDDSANFYADVKSSEDISDMLLMIFTYKSEQN